MSLEVMTTEQVADLLQIHRKVVGRYVRTKGLPAHRIGQQYRFLRAEVIAWVASHKGR